MELEKLKTVNKSEFVSICCCWFYEQWSDWAIYQLQKQIRNIEEFGFPYEVIIATHLDKDLYSQIPNLKYIKTSRFLTIGKKRNLITENLDEKSTLCYILDDDDYYVPQRFRIQYNMLMKNSKVQFVTTSNIICYDIPQNEFHWWGSYSESCLLAKTEYIKTHAFDPTNMREGNGLLKNSDTG